MADYDLYAISAETLDAAMRIATSALAVPFCPHDSGYIGSYYLATGERNETFKLRQNIDPLDGEAAEADHPDHKFLLYVEDGDRGDELRLKIVRNSHIVLLRHESF